MARTSNVWTGYISFGLINIPVAVRTAEQSHELRFNMIDKSNFSRVRYNRVNAKTGREVDNKNIAKGYEYEKDKYVLMNEADFRKANPRASETLEVHQFVPYEELDPMLFEKPYYLIPGKGGEKSYFLFQRALEKSDRVALATVVMHGKEHLTAVLSCNGHLVLETLRFAHEIKHPDEIKELDVSAKKRKFSAQELDTAMKLVEQMSGKWDINDYKDHYYLDLKKYIDKKIRAGQGHYVVEEEEPAEESTRTIAVRDTDLMALLKKSLGKDERSATARGSHAHRATHGRRKGPHPGKSGHVH